MKAPSFLAPGAGDPDDGSLQNDLQVAATNRLVEALVASENRMRLRIDLLSEIVFELDARRALVFVSRAWSHLMGMPTEQALGRPLLDFVHADDRAACAAMVADAPPEPAFRRPVIRLVRPDGNTLAMELSLVAMRDGSTMGALHDVTEQLRVQQEFERLSLVANHTDNYVVITDALGRTEWVNDAFCRGTGYRPEDIVGKTPGEVLQGPETDPVEIARISEALKARRSFSSELVNYAKDGRPYWITIYVTPIHDAQGHLLRFISVQTDTTEMRHIREQLEDARRKAEDASRAKSQFLSAMSHEIRTPMNGVLGLTTLLMESGLDPTQRQYASMIANSGNSLLAIINDILDFSKVEAGKLTIEDLDFDLYQLLDDVVGIHMHRAREKSLALRSRIEPGVSQYFRGDANRLRQVLNNLLGNATKFTERGAITLNVTMAERDDTRSWLRFEIRDTGIGIPVDKQPLLFQPFSQIDGSSSRRFGGTGLGLAITKQLVELMHGSIAVQSAAGAGSTFTVVLPFRRVAGPRPGAPAAAPQLAPPRRPDARLLVVEDNPTNQVVARGLLKKLGYQNVLMVGDGAQAVDAVRAEPFDLVLMDCQMPVMDGYAATMRIRELGFTLPVVAMTANAMREDREQSLACGMNDHLAKPVLLKDLAQMFERWLPADAPASQGTRAGGAAALPEPRTLPALDRADLLDRLDGDEDLVQEILRAAAADLPGIVESMLVARRDGDPAALRMHAHALKGAAANVGAAALSHEAALIEADARAGQLPGTDALVAELQRFRAAIDGAPG